MLTKTTKKTLVKNETSNSKTKKSVSKISTSKTSTKVEKKDSSQKVVVKRRKLDLTPTKASAVAIASQANRAKKQALIERMESWKSLPKNITSKEDTKIPLWVWIFFGGSLLLFCISFYQAVFRPAIENNIITPNIESDIYQVEWDNSGFDIEDLQENENLTISWDSWENLQNDSIPTTAIETIQAYFDRLSNRQFTEAFDLMIPALRNTSEIRDHFTSFRMNPLLDWIEWWKLAPTNFQYVKSPSYWKDVYNFDLSYVMSSDQSKYDETWEFTVSNQWDSPKISSIRCITPKCSYHPIFWPENFGLMR